MEWVYIRTPGRGIDVDLGDEHPAWNESLADSISSMPPRSSRELGLSTYWIDHVLSGLQAGSRSLVCGNSTEIVVENGAVIARSLYETFDDERMSLEVFERILHQWHAEIIAHRHEFRIDTTYRRNGF